MHTNLELNNRFNPALRAPIISVEGKIYRQIETELLESKIVTPNALRSAQQSPAKQSQMEADNNEKSAFLANICHEIRTPIGAIIGLGSILLATKLDDKQRQCAAILQSSAEALLEMANRMLDTDKMGARTPNLKNMPFNMKALLDQIVGIMSVKAQEKNIGLTLTYEANTAQTFVGDSGHIRQIVMNLISNAIKFTNTGGVVVSLAADGNRNDIAISVTDTGIGISQDKIGIIFDRFVQADPSISRQYGGTGLGLSISRKLAEDMGGSISVTSLHGKGSTFTFNICLPMHMCGDDTLETRCDDKVIYLDTAVNAAKLPPTA